MTIKVPKPILLALVVLVAGAVGAVAALLLTRDDGSEQVADTTQTTESAITRRDFKSCLDESGAGATFELNGGRVPQLQRLKSAAAGGEGGMTAFSVDSPYAQQNAQDLIGTSQPDFFFMPDSATAKREAQGFADENPDSDVVYGTNVVAVWLVGPAPDDQNEIVEACLAGS